MSVSANLYQESVNIYVICPTMEAYDQIVHALGLPHGQCFQCETVSEAVIAARKAAAWEVPVAFVGHTEFIRGDYTGGDSNNWQSIGDILVRIFDSWDDIRSEFKKS